MVLDTAMFILGPINIHFNKANTKNGVKKKMFLKIFIIK